MKKRDLFLAVSFCVFGGALVILAFFMGIATTSGKRLTALGLLFLFNGFRGISQYRAGRFPENVTIPAQNTTLPMSLRVCRIVQYNLAFTVLLVVLIDTLSSADLRTPILRLGGLLILSLAVTEILTRKQFQNDQTE